MATVPLPPASSSAGRPPPVRASPDEWLFGRYHLVPATRRLHAGDRVHELDARAIAVLECLLRHAGEVVPRAMLIAEAWPVGVVVFDSAVSKVMRRLRMALGDSQGSVLQTIYGEGYRVALPATRLPPRPDSATVPASGAKPRSDCDADAASIAGTASGRRTPSASAHLIASAQPGTTAVARDRGGHGRWLLWLPWVIAALATLVAGCLAWLLLRPAGPG